MSSLKQSTKKVNGFRPPSSRLIILPRLPPALRPRPGRPRRLSRGNLIVSRLLRRHHLRRRHHLMRHRMRHRHRHLLDLLRRHHHHLHLRRRRRHLHLLRHLHLRRFPHPRSVPPAVVAAVFAAVPSSLRAARVDLMLRNHDHLHRLPVHHDDLPGLHHHLLRMRMRMRMRMRVRVRVRRRPMRAVLYKRMSGWSSKASGGVERRRGRGLKAWDGRRETTAKALKDRRSPRRRGRMGTSV